MAVVTIGSDNKEPLRAAADRPTEDASSLIPTLLKLGAFVGNEVNMPL